MPNSYYNKSKLYRAFTLIEILVVIGLIALLAALTIIAINPQKMFAMTRNTERWNGVAVIDSALKQWIVDGNTIQSILEGNGSSIRDCTSGSVAIMDQDTLAEEQTYLSYYLVPEYVVALPRDPTNSAGDDTGYRLCRLNSTRFLITAPGAELNEIISLPTSVYIKDYSHLSTNLTAHWRMNEASWNGTAGEVIDSSTSSRHGVRSGDANTDIGKFSRAATFDGSGDYLSFGDHVEHDIVPPFTISLWVNFTQLPGTRGQDAELINKYTFAPNRQYTLAVGTGNDVYFWKSHNGTNGQYVVYGYLFTAGDLGAWKNIVVTSDAAGDTFLYVDGNLIHNNQMTDLTFVNASVPLLIGRRGTGANHIHGMMDDVRIYNRFFTTQDVADIFEYQAD